MKTQGYRFIISGVISAVVDWGVTALTQFLFGFAASRARLVGFIFGTITAYMINRRWTFQANHSWKRLFYVAVLYTVTGWLNMTLYAWGFHLLEPMFPRLVASMGAFVFAQGIATVLNFFAQRMFIFKQPKSVIVVEQTP
ncbi:GtrA family protein [Corynebacterium hindlerae]|uniref:GtrA family protein n=1 Tax=Corynebacterium hindlerae TaxID=699041 RepID=UPI001AD75760|nr:GtrA family protein [Corynebacterium hindlerae]QTH60707.1 GtrA family protein [Corynebacterium hindlerae]